MKRAQEIKDFYNNSPKFEFLHKSVLVSSSIRNGTVHYDFILFKTENHNIEFSEKGVRIFCSPFKEGKKPIFQKNFPSKLLAQKKIKETFPKICYKNIGSLTLYTPSFESVVEDIENVTGVGSFQPYFEKVKEEVTTTLLEEEEFRRKKNQCLDELIAKYPKEMGIAKFNYSGRFNERVLFLENFLMLEPFSEEFFAHHGQFVWDLAFRL